MSADDDEIDDLFSFSTDTPSSAILGSTQTDDDKSNIAAMSREKSDSFDFDDLGPAPSATTTSSRVNIDDDMDDIFGSSTIGTASKEIETTSGDDDFLDILGDVPNSEKSPNNLTVQEKEETTTSTPDSDEYVKLDSTVGEEIQHPVTLQEDDFHKHDSGTRDFLEWLDKDGPGEKDSGVSSGDKILTPSLDISITSPTNDVSDEEDSGFDFAKDILGEKTEEDEAKKEDIVVDAKDEHVENEEKAEKSSTDPSPTIVAIPDTPISPEPSETESPDTLTESSTTNSKSNDDKVEEPSTGDEPETKVVPPPSPPKEIIEFSTLSEAIESMDSSLKQIKELYQIEKSDISQAERANFYLKIICGKTVDSVMNNSSIADSFRHWKDVQFETEKEESDIPYQGLISLLKEESNLYTDNICKALSLEEDPSEISSSLFSLLLFHYKNGGYKSQENKSSWDPLLFPVVSNILSAGVPAIAASVVLNNIFPVAMPLMALTGDERFEAAKTLHGKFYLLAAYNLPLVVLHLDKFIPGWHLPKKIPDPEEIALRSKSPEKSKVVEDDEDGEEDEDEDSSTKKGRNLEANGSIPISWFVSLFADDKSLRNPNLLLRLWDILLVTGDPSLKYFLVLSVLEDHSDALLMLRGKALEIQIQSIMQSQLVLKEEDKDEEYQFVQDWCRRAKVLVESTPKSVVAELSKAEDEAVTYALLQRQMKAEERLQARLDAEAEAHRAAAELEKKKRQEENNYQDHKKFLIKYYEKHNPEKVDAVDEILERYKGRLDELDDNLADKYGHGFIPVNKKISTSTAKLFSSINLRRNRIIQKVNFKSKDTEEELQKAEDKNLLLKHQVAVEVSPDEILPVICTSKAQTMEKDESTDYLVARGRYSTDDVYIPLKFYLVDSRPDHVSEAQGKFPTAVNLGPEAMHDPEKHQKELEMFESFRGAVHICVMGEGIASFPQLYSHELNAQERALAEEDTSRTSMCALFFIKKGFPFVSILKGGYAGAHAYLSREGPSKSLYASSVLVDYDENLSLHSRLEHEYAEFLKNGSHSVRKKIGNTVHNMLDVSLVKLTQSVQIIDEFAEDIDYSESKQKFMSRFFRGGENEDDSSLGSAPTTNNNEEEDATSPESTKQESSKFEMRFKNIFNKSENDEQSSDAEKNTEAATDGSGGEQKKLKWNFLSKSPSPAVNTNDNEEEIVEEEEGSSKASKWKFSFSRGGDDVSTTDTETLDESKGSDTESSDPVDNKNPLFQMKNLFSKAATSPEGDDEVTETDTEKETADEAASTTSIKLRFSKPSFQVKNPFASKGVESPAEPNNDNDEEQQSSSADETKTMANLRTRFSNFSMKVQVAAAASAEDVPQQDSRAIYDFMSSGNAPVPKTNMFTGMSRKLFDKEKKKDGVEDSPESVKENKPATPSFSTKMFQRSPFKKKNDTELANVLSDDSSAPSDLSLNEDPTPSLEQSEKSEANDAEEESAVGETSSVKVDKAQDTNTVTEHESSTSSMEGVELDDI